jgi:multiple sugar transport system substrate-binding protein
MVPIIRTRLSATLLLFCVLSIAVSACQPFVTGVAATATTQPTRRPTTQPTIIPDERSTLAAELQVSPGALAGTKLTFWHPLSGKSADVLNQLVNEFNQRNVYGIFVTPSSYFSESELSAEMENVFQTNSPLPSMVMASADLLNKWQQDTGDVIDLEPYLNEAGVGLTQQQLADLFPSFFPKEADEAGRLGLPAYRSGGVLFYNQTWANELGFQNPPATLEEFKQQACAAAEANTSDKKRTNDGTGGWFINTGWESAVSWLQAFGFNHLQAGGSGDFSFSTPEAEKALTYLKSLNDQGCAWSGRKADPQEYFATRQALFYSASLEDIASQALTNTRLDSQDQWIPIAYPDQTASSEILTTGYDYAILKSDARSQMAAWLFIKWLSDPARHARLAAADTTFPLSYSEVATLGSLGEQNLQWQQALGFISQARQAPDFPDWWMVRQILEDAFWKSLQPNVTESDLPIILRELDATISEVLGR